MAVVNIINRGEVLLALGLASKDLTPDDLALIESLIPKATRACSKFVGFEIAQGTWTEYHPERASDADRDPLVEGAVWTGYGGVVTADWSTGGERVIQARRLPMRSITSLKENLSAWVVANPPNFPASTLLTEGLHYQGDWSEPGLSTTGEIHRTAGTWSSVLRSVELIYVAGYTAAELQASYPDIKEAVIITAKTKFLEHKKHQTRASGMEAGELLSESLEGHSVTYNPETQGDNYGLKMELPPIVKDMLKQYVRLGQFYGV